MIEFGFFHHLSILLVAGFSLSLAVLSLYIGLRSRWKKEGLYLGIASLLEAAYCVLYFFYLRADDSDNARFFIGVISSFMCYMTYLLGQLTNELLQWNKAWFHNLQKTNLIFTCIFSLAVFFDLTANTNVTVIAVHDYPGTRLQKTVEFSMLGQAYLLWVISVFVIFGSLLLKKCFQNQRYIAPVAIGVSLYFLTIINDFNLVFQIYDFWPVQHLGFLATALGFTLSFGKRFCEATEDLEQALQNLKQQRNEMIRMEKLKTLGQMSTYIAHEINNPLAIIHGLTETQKRQIQQNLFYDKEKITNSLMKIQNATTRIQKIIRGLSAVSRNDLNDSLEQIKLVTIIEESLEFCQIKLQKHAVQISYSEVDPDLSLYCRPTQISQVIINFINNSCDAIQEQKLRWIKLKSELTDRYINLHITDSGPGIPAEIREKILEPFFSTKTRGMGIGVGLSISQSIMRSHHGSITLDDSSENTSFILSLPKFQVNESKQAEAGLFYQPHAMLNRELQKGCAHEI
ncbi:MAG: sensor histidine kinase [Oligoflexus sp.]